MTNFEQYKDFFLKTLEEKGTMCIGLVKGKPRPCDEISCSLCDIYGEKDGCQNNIKKWLQEEYKEPVIDWAKVSVDTKILVRDYENDQWFPRHFAKYDEKTSKVFVWLGGGTSWTTTDINSWDYAKLAEDDEEAEKYKEPEVNWPEENEETEKYKESKVEDSEVDRAKVPVDACSDASRFVELPCKVGDTVYAISTEEPSLISFGKIVDGKLNSFHITEHGTLASGVGFYRNISEFGKTVFLTRGEAEKALKEREDNAKIH